MCTPHSPWLHQVVVLLRERREPVRLIGCYEETVDATTHPLDYVQPLLSCGTRMHVDRVGARTKS